MDIYIYTYVTQELTQLSHPRIQHAKKNDSGMAMARAQTPMGELASMLRKNNIILKLLGVVGQSVHMSSVLQLASKHFHLV